MLRTTGGRAVTSASEAARSMARETAIGISLVLFAASLWSTSGLFIKVLTMESFALIGLRSALSFLALAPLIRPSALRFDWNLLLLIVAFSATQMGFVFATRWTTAANAIALQSAAPVWVFLIGCLAVRRIQPRLLWPILLIVCGIAAMLSEPAEGASLNGNLLALFTGFAFALTQIAFKRIGQPAVGVIALSNLCLAAACVAVRPGAFLLAAIPVWEWVSLVYLGAIQIGLGMVCFIAGLRRIPVGQASILILIEPLLNPLWVFLVIGEIPSRYGFAGFALILAGLLADLWVRLWLPPGR
ncbi:MAG: DMT family transporter [SAR324 cluster bacterium]|nr:DMT family transporter [SAR324 cluster bacterium]